MTRKSGDKAAANRFDIWKGVKLLKCGCVVQIAFFSFSLCSVLRAEEPISKWHLRRRRIVSDKSLFLDRIGENWRVKLSAEGSSQSELSNYG